MPTSAGHIKRSFKRGFLRIHPARHSMELNGARASVKEAKFPTETLPNFKLKGSGDAHRRWFSFTFAAPSSPLSEAHIKRAAA